MNLLVAGADRVDAGKTTFSVGLLEHTGATGFKPRAGNDHWFHHDDVRHAVSAGRLYGKDARRLAAASPGDHAPEDINPVHRLWTPSPGSGTGLLGREDRQFLVDRVGETFVVNDTVTLPAWVREALPLGDAVRVGSLPEFNDVMARLHTDALEGIADRVATFDRAVVESYGNVARPLRGFDPDAVAVVEPGLARVYRGDRYGKAARVASGGPDEGQLEERVPRVLGYVDPVESVPLPALGSAARTDPAAVAEAYEPAYESLLSVVA